MKDDAMPSLTAEQRIIEIVNAYLAAQAAGEPYDLEAILAQEPELAAAVYSRLRLGKADQDATLSVVVGAPAPITSVDGSHPTLESPPARADAPGLGEFGDYELLQEIARGGMGVVFCAREKSLNRIVALKMILAGRLATPDEVRRFRLEAEEASRLDHPNIVPIYHIGEIAGQHYFTMKLIEEGTLGELDRGPKADLKRVARLMATVAGAVHYAHRHGILHRDIKPGNILIDPEGRPHVTDFGLAKPLSGPAGQTQSGVVLGTPAYISPEQAAARKDLTTATDIYGLGAVLYDLITGQPPFMAGSTLDTLVKVLEEEPVPPHRLNPRVDRDLETICLTCLNKDPRRRYASAEALANDLERYLAGEPIRARRVSRLERARKWIRRRPLAAALVAVFVLAGSVLAAGGWIFSARLKVAADQAKQAQAIAEEGQREADRKRQQLNDYLVYLNERLANLSAERSLRLEFLQQGLALCEEFRKGHGEDAETRRQTALLYRCLGDLEQERSEPKKAIDAYRRAQEILEQLDADIPGLTLYRNDLALVYSKQAHQLETTGEHAEALEVLHRAIDMEDRLAAESSAPRDIRQRAAEFRHILGTFLEEQKKPAEAEAAYRGAVDLMGKLVLDRAAQPRTHLQFCNTASTLAWLLADSKPADAEALFQRCMRQLREVHSAKPDNPEITQALWGGYTDLAAFYKQRGQHAELAALANQVRGDFLGEQRQAYQAARFLADAVRVVAAQQALSAPQRDALTEEYAAAAVAMLERAIKEGFSSRAQFEEDPDLDPLRKRKDFSALLTELERRYPSLAMEQELMTLQEFFNSARKQYQYQMQGARTRAEFQRAQAIKPDLAAYSEKYLQLARKHRDSWAAMEALVRVLEACQPDEVGPAAAPIRQQAVQMLEKDHLLKPEFNAVCMRFARTSVPEAEGLLKRAMTQHPQRDVRGLAGLTLAVNLARAGNKARKTDPAHADLLMLQAQQHLDQVLKEYGGVPIGRSTLGEIARQELEEVRYLSEGSPVRDIVGEDLHGRPLRLSDPEFRDKVVVLDFWADWCGYCRQMYSQEQDLVERYKDKPFVLLGINCDEDRDSISHIVARRGLLWRSWWDGGPDGGRICQEWHVHSFPNIWVLDHKHVIRFKFRGMAGKELDEAVAKLVGEAQEQQASNK